MFTDHDDKGGSCENNVERAESIENREKRRAKCNRRRLCFLSICITCILTTVTLVPIIYHVFYKQSVCTSVGCVQGASQLLSRMDTTVNPCEHFYKYACGRWVNTSSSPLPSQQTWHTIAETGFHAYDKLSTFMEKIHSKEIQIADLSSGEESLTRLYHKCMDLETLRKTGYSSWRDFLQQIGGWLEASEPIEIDDHYLEDMILNAYKYAVFPLFWVGVDVDYTNSTQYVITIEEQLPLLIYSQLYMMDREEVTAQGIFEGRVTQPLLLLKEAGLHMASLTGIDRDDERVQMAIAEAIELEWRLVLISSVHEGKDKQTSNYHTTTVRQLQETMSSIDWEYFLSRLLGAPVNPKEPIAIKAGLLWLGKLERILRLYKQTENGMRILERYIKWKSLFLNLGYTQPPCDDETKNPSFNALMQMYVGAAPLRKQFCILRSSAHFPLSAASLLRRTENESARKNRQLMQEIFEEIRQSFSSILKRTDVFDELTREHVLRKIGNVSFFSSYPDNVDESSRLEEEGSYIVPPTETGQSDFFWTMITAAGNKHRRDMRRLSRSVNPSDWVDNFNALSLNAIHNYERNAVLYPLSLTRSPFIDYRMPSALNYAGVGFFFSHEIAHAFDESGRLFGSTGNLGQYWTKISEQKMKEKDQCFLRQYAQLSDEEGETGGTASKTLQENIADNIGLQIAYKAFERQDDLNDGKLPGIELTPKQAFFVAYAQNWCAKKGESIGVHSEEELRVLGPLQNMEPFQQAFGCSSESPLVTEQRQRCVVF